MLCTNRFVQFGYIPLLIVLERIGMLDDLVAIIINDEKKKHFLTLSANVRKLYKAVLPGAIPLRTRSRITAAKMQKQKMLTRVFLISDRWLLGYASACKKRSI